MLVPVLVTAVISVLLSVLVCCLCVIRTLRRELADAHAREQQHRTEVQQQAAAEAIIRRAHDDTPPVPEQRHLIRYSRAQGHLRPVRNISTTVAAVIAGAATAIANRSRGVALASAAVSVVSALSLVILAPESEDNRASSQPPRLLPERSVAPSGLPDGVNAPVPPDGPRSDATPAPTSPAAAPATRAPSLTTSHEQPPAPSSTTTTAPTTETTTETETRTAEPAPKGDPPDAYERCINNPRAAMCVIDLSHIARLVDDVDAGLDELTASK